MNDKPRLILYMPGMKPKPAPEEHRAMLWTCLLEGVRRTSASVAREMALSPDCFRLVPWPALFYNTQRDLSLDVPGIDRLLELPHAQPCDVEEARHWHKRIGRLAYLLADAFPFLIGLVANPNVKVTLEDSLRYFRNRDGMADRIREMLSTELDSAWNSGARILLLAHSLGSVIAYDVLWSLTHKSRSPVEIDLFLTIGSPLGLNFAKHRLLSAHETGPGRYPHNIRRWRNLAAVGEMTALDRAFADDYRDMVNLGLVSSISDKNDLLTYFRSDEGLNVHKCYGYMVNSDLGRDVGDWWRG